MCCSRGHAAHTLEKLGVGVNSALQCGTHVLEVNNALMIDTIQDLDLRLQLPFHLMCHLIRVKNLPPPTPHFPLETLQGGEGGEAPI